MPATTLQRVWIRPTLMIFSESQPQASNATEGVWDLGSTFLYLTDDNRSDMQISLERIESKKRMINGRMRAYHVADKKTFSVNWRDLPSNKNEVSEVKFSGLTTGWASSQEMLDWHNNHTDSFYLTLVYDSQSASANPLKHRIETYSVFFEDFSFNIKKRGTTHDLWDISMSLVEV